MCYMKHKKNYRLLEVLVPLENVAAAYEIFSMHHHQEKQWKSGGKSNQANHQKSTFNMLKQVVMNMRLARLTKTAKTCYIYLKHHEFLHCMDILFVQI